MIPLHTAGPILKAGAPPVPSSISVIGSTIAQVASNSITLATPGGVAAGDLGIIVAKGGGTVNTPSGWTALQNIFYKFFSGPEPSVTLSCTSSTNYCAVLMVCRGVHATSPFAANNTKSTFSGTSITSTALTAPFASTLAITMARCGTTSAAPTLTGPGSWTLQNTAVKGQFSTGFATLSGIANGGSTGTPAWTTANAVNSATNEMFILRLVGT